MVAQEENENFANMTAEDKNVYLHEFWKVPDDSQFELLGLLNSKKSSSDGKKDVFFIDNVCNPDGNPISFPDSSMSFTIFIGVDIQDKLKGCNLSVGDFVSIKLDSFEFAPQYEQNKRGTSFLINVDVGDLNKLQKIPKELLNALTKKIDNEVLLEDWIIEKKYEEIINIDEKKQKLLEKHQSEFSALEENCNKKKQDLKDQISNLEEELTSKTDELKQTKTDLESKQKSLENIESSLEKLNESKNLLQSEIDKISSERDSIVNKVNNTVLEVKNLVHGSINKVNLLVSLGLLDKETVKHILDDSVQNNSDSLFSGSYEDAINFFHSFLFSHGAFYKKSLIRNFCALLNTHDLILFAGDSGIGKTNLVKRMAEATGGVAKIIPVKPNWTSSEDLLGYYNPIEKRYISTPFLDAIIEACDHSDKLYLICLDEMNLARVEYYFADFLSKLEERNDNVSIELYSSNEEKILSNELSELFDSLINNEQVKKILSDHNIDSNKLSVSDVDVDLIISEIGDNDLKEKILKLKTNLKYRSSISIPSNIRFIGTINVDDTTYYLSPKIIDRVHIIKFENPLFITKEEIENEIVDAKELVTNINPGTFFEHKVPYPNYILEGDNEKIVARLVKLSQRMRDIGISFGARVVNQAILYSRSMKKFGETDDDVIFNNILLQKIFPRLLFDGSEPACNSDSKTKIDILGDISNYLKEELPGDNSNITCISELDRVIHMAQHGNNQINYWIK